MNRVIAVLVVALVFSARLLAQDAPADLVKKLGSSTFIERETAAKKLEKLGAPALPALRDSFTSADLETKRRALAVMERIEESILRDDIVRASTLRIRINDLLLENSLRRIEKQTGLVLGGVDPNPPLSIDTGELPFWQAWHSYCKSAKLHEGDPTRWSAKLKPVTAEDAARLLEIHQTGRLDRRTSFEMPRVQFADKPDGAFVVDDTSSVRVRVKWQSLENELAVLAFEVRPEPRFKLGAPPRVEITRIVDAEDKERRIELHRPYPDQFHEVGEMLALHAGEMQFGGNFHLKSLVWRGAAQPIKELRGHVRLEVVRNVPLLEITKVLDAVGKSASFDGLKMTIERAERIDKQLRLHLRFVNVESLMPPGAQPQAVRIRPGVVGIRGPMDIAFERLELRGPNGNVHGRVEGTYERAENAKSYQARLLYNLPAEGTDLTLVLTKAPRTVTAEVPFVVRDVSVPVMQ